MTIIKELDALHVNGEEYKFPAGEGDMKYADFSLVEKTGATVTLDLFSYVEPSANFTVNAPSEIKEGQMYILRVVTGATPYTMTLGTGITNPYNESITLTANTVHQFGFLAIDGDLELQPSAAQSGGGEWGTITGTLSNQTDLNTALTAKANASDVNTKTFFLSGTGSSSEVLEVAQAAYDWFVAGKNPILVLDNQAYTLHGGSTSTRLRFESDIDGSNSTSDTHLSHRGIGFSLSDGTVQSVFTTGSLPLSYSGSYLRTDYDYGTPYTPQYNGSPATKKYVDDNINVKLFKTSDPITNAEALSIVEYTSDYNGKSAIIQYNYEEYFFSYSVDRSQEGTLYTDGYPYGYIYMTHPQESGEIKIIDITAIVGLNSSTLISINHYTMGTILNDQTGTTSNLYKEWVGTETEYNNLSQYGSNSLYFILEE